jgi:formamidopyrimidine-DNA glycosylase
VPELPEVETISRDLDEAVSGATITGIKIRKPDVIREVSPATLKKRVVGAKIKKSRRKAKHIVTDLSTGDHIVVQPRFTGAWIVDDGSIAPSELKYSTIEFILKDKRSLHYCDTRRLGTLSLMSPKRFDEYFGKLGVEPLEPEFTSGVLLDILRGSSQAVKKVLMDQYKIVGVGNIYANEALWRARIDPSRAGSKVTPAEAKLLRDSIVNVLNEAIETRGSSIRDYRDGKGEKGGFVERLAAYGRAGEKCLRCGGGAKMVGTHAIDGRQTVLCPKCQH